METAPAPSTRIAWSHPALVLLVCGLAECVIGLLCGQRLVSASLALLLGWFAGTYLGLKKGALVAALSSSVLLGTATLATLGGIGAWLEVFTYLLIALAMSYSGARIAHSSRQLDRRHAERIAVERELEAVRGRSQALLEALGRPVYRLDRQGHAQELGPSELTDATSKSALGASFEERFAAPHALLLEKTKEAITQNAPVRLTQRTGQGSNAADMEAMLLPLDPNAVLAVIRDVTELESLKRELEAAHADALQAAGMKGRFLATMSHQIRTPMNGVIGMTNVLLQTKLGTEQREYTTIIRNSGEALLSILDDVMDQSRIEAGQFALAQEPFALRTMLEEVVELLSAQAHEKRLEIASIIDARVPDWVSGDRGRLRQVITNLLGNAVKFTRHGEVVLRVTVVGHDRDTALIRFDVVDTGVGISKEQQKLLFQDYQQASPRISREFGGTGLGLAISRELIERMGGHMVVESVPLQGSTFSFTAHFGTAQQGTTGSMLLPQEFGGARLLAVELHSLTQEVLEHELSPFGTKLFAVSSMEQALELLRANEPYDAMFLDLPIGTSEGEAKRKVMEAVRLSKNTPVAVLHAMGQRGAGDAAREAGAALCLARPLKRGALYDGLAGVFGVTPGAGMRRRRATDSVTPSARSLRARVLVAEDNLVNQKVAVRTLEMLGCVAQVAENGAAALEAIQHGDFDLVLMDCQMPVMDGYEATRRIRALEGGGRHTAIVAMTANAMKGDRERCLEAGMDDYVPKPVTLAQLDAALQRWLPVRRGYASREFPAHQDANPPRTSS